jgi:hypothetical protein
MTVLFKFTNLIQERTRLQERILPQERNPNYKASLNDLAIQYLRLIAKESPTARRSPTTIENPAAREEPNYKTCSQ